MILVEAIAFGDGVLYSNKSLKRNWYLEVGCSCNKSPKMCRPLGSGRKCRLHGSQEQLMEAQRAKRESVEA